MSPLPPTRISNLPDPVITHLRTSSLRLIELQDLKKRQEAAQTNNAPSAYDTDTDEPTPKERLYDLCERTFVELNGETYETDFLISEMELRGHVLDLEARLKALDKMVHTIKSARMQLKRVQADISKLVHIPTDEEEVEAALAAESGESSQEKATMMDEDREEDREAKRQEDQRRWNTFEACASAFGKARQMVLDIPLEGHLERPSSLAMGDNNDDSDGFDPDAATQPFDLDPGPGDEAHADDDGSEWKSDAEGAGATRRYDDEEEEEEEEDELYPPKRRKPSRSTTIQGSHEDTLEDSALSIPESSEALAVSIQNKQKRKADRNKYMRKRRRKNYEEGDDLDVLLKHRRCLRCQNLRIVNKCGNQTPCKPCSTANAVCVRSHPTATSKPNNANANNPAPSIVAPQPAPSNSNAHLPSTRQPMRRLPSSSSTLAEDDHPTQLARTIPPTIASLHTTTLRNHQQQQLINYSDPSTVNPPFSSPHTVGLRGVQMTAKKACLFDLENDSMKTFCRNNLSAIPGLVAWGLDIYQPPDEKKFQHNYKTKVVRNYAKKRSEGERAYAVLRKVLPARELARYGPMEQMTKEYLGPKHYKVTAPRLKYNASKEFPNIVLIHDQRHATLATKAELRRQLSNKIEYRTSGDFSLTPLLISSPAKLTAQGEIKDKIYPPDTPTERKTKIMKRRLFSILDSSRGPMALRKARLVGLQQKLLKNNGQLTDLEEESDSEDGDEGVNDENEEPEEQEEGEDEEAEEVWVSPKESMSEVGGGEEETQPPLSLELGVAGQEEVDYDDEEDEEMFADDDTPF
ncbi:hypothetical protein HDV05_004207 [Chytridiales sp. JEL 0842]|nr:hypothetical protein HDV05_004207 [Chytridiales sp. JEL 0842]